MTTRTLLAAAVAALAFSPGAHAQSLTGSQVTAANYCCTAPTESNRATNAATATVGPAIEFPQGTFTSLTSSLSVVPAAVDVGSNYIDIAYSAGGTTAAGGFNGFVFSFAGAPTITGVSIDPASTYSPVVTFDANTVYVNEAGLTLTPTSRALISVTAVPEPETYALMLGGMALLGLAARRRRR
jgi:hypothetical protein